MELEGSSGGHAKSAYEVAMERLHGKRERLANSTPSASLSRPGPPDLDGESEGSVFVKSDHVSVRDNDLDRRKPRLPDRPVSSLSPMTLDRVEAVDEQKDLAGDDEMPALPVPVPEEYEVACHWGGPMFDYGGYARMNRSYIFHLHARGALVKVRPMESVTDVNTKTEEFLRELADVELPGRWPRVYGMTIPDLLSHGGRKILYTMMETSNHIHHEYAERLNLADEVWVPCQWNVDTFRASGVLVPIKVMPLGVDVGLFKPGADPLPLRAKGFRFISVFGWSYRKGFDVMIQAFLEEFSSKDDVSLVMSTRFVGQVSRSGQDRIASDFKQVRALVGKPDGELPHILLHSARTPDRDMPRLYAAGHCFVLISRGEGWCLPACEAAACGLPVIAADHGGQRDFLTADNSYLVPPDGYFTSNRQDIAFRNLAWISHFYEGQEFPAYERPAIDLCRAHMRRVYENYGEAKARAEKLRARIVSEFSWEKAVDRVYGRLKEICKEVKSEP